MDLVGKVALVTGSSSGIGEAIAKSLAKEGVGVIVNSGKSAEKGTRVSDIINKNGGDSIYVQADVSDQKQTKILFEKIIDHFNKVDILINNAGNAQSGDYDDLEVWDSQHKNILMSMVTASDEFLKHIDTKNISKIVNVSSIYGSTLGGKLNFMAYSAAKAAMNNTTVNMAKMLGGKVLVNAVAPRWTWTPAWGDDKDEEENRLKVNFP